MDIVKDNKAVFIALVVIIVIILIIGIFYTRKSFDGLSTVSEAFENLELGSMSGFGFQKMESGSPLFVNFYSPQFGSDHALSNALRKLKMFFQAQPRTPELMNAQDFGRIPIIIIPSIGASKIYGRWNKNGSDYVKTLDAYGNFETSDKWKCKDVQDSWTNLWFPQDKDGLAEYCWSEVTKIDTASGTLANQQGVSTAVNDMGSLDFIKGYDTLIRALNDIGYINGITLFGANYDFRKFTTDANMYYAALTNLINKLGSRCIIIGHGLGACIANNYLVSMDPSWKNDKIAAFFSISGTYGGIPKALRVFLSGEKLPNDKESQLIRDTAINWDSLQMLMPSKTMYGQSNLVSNNGLYYNASKIPELVSMAGSSIPQNVMDTVKSFSEKALLAPGVPVYIMAGVGRYTESSYDYDSLGTSFDSVDVKHDYTGDGTVPDFVPKKIYDAWNASQSKPVNFKTYQGLEHLEIMSVQEPIGDILNTIVSLQN
jgi:hypothetical protein